jgi:hypothetical protein
MKRLLYIAILVALLLLTFNLLITRLLLGLNNLLLFAAVIAAIAAFIYEQRSKNK